VEVGTAYPDTPGRAPHPAWAQDAGKGSRRPSKGTDTSMQLASSLLSAALKSQHLKAGYPEVTAPIKPNCRHLLNYLISLQTSKDSDYFCFDYHVFLPHNSA
jgi:hypothetical protein